MAEVKAWIALVGIPADQRALAKAAAQAAARALESYLRAVVLSPKTRFSSARVGLDPPASSIGAQDYLVHLCLGSLIESAASFDNQTTQRGGSGGTAGGATAKMGSSGVLSEVYWTTIKNRGMNSDDRGLLLAGQAFHELAHNKCHGKASIIDNSGFVHANGGGGLLMASPTVGALKQRPSKANVDFVAGFLDQRVPQYPYFLYSDWLGF